MIRAWLFAVFVAIAPGYLGVLPATAATSVTPERLAQLSRGINADNVVNNSRFATYDGAVFAKLKAMGFTYMRLPIDPSYVVTGAPVDGQPGPSDSARVATGLARIDKFLADATSADFAVTLCAQPQAALLAAPAAQYKSVVLAADRVLAARYAGRYTPDQIQFELVNEPHVDNPSWNAFAPVLLAAIRAAAPNHTIIVPPAWWDLASNFKGLTPLADGNVVYTMHVYAPSTLTAQGAGGGQNPAYIWPKPAGSTDKTEWTAARTDQYIKVGVDWAAANRVPLIMNEFGTTKVGDHASWTAWVAFVRAEARKYGFGWAWWAYDGRLFGLNPHGRGYDPDLVALLTQ